nr:MAG TPA: hypothetical protein [Caudoviricetes sp.]
MPVVLTGSFFIHTSTRTQKPILRILSNFNIFTLTIPSAKLYLIHELYHKYGIKCVYCQNHYLFWQN